MTNNFKKCISTIKPVENLSCNYTSLKISTIIVLSKCYVIAVTYMMVHVHLLTAKNAQYRT